MCYHTFTPLLYLYIIFLYLLYTIHTYYASQCHMNRRHTARVPNLLSLVLSKIFVYIVLYRCQTFEMHFQSVNIIPRGKRKGAKVQLTNAQMIYRERPFANEKHLEGRREGGRGVQTGQQTKKFRIFMSGIISVRRRYLGGHR